MLTGVLVGLDRFAAVTDLVASGEYTAPGTFEAALRDEIVRNPTLKPDPAGKATRGGLQTAADLAFASEGAVAALIDQLRSAVDAFVAGLPDRSDDPFLASPPEIALIHAWALVYPGLMLLVAGCLGRLAVVRKRGRSSAGG